MGRTVISRPRSVAQAFADHLNGVLNNTVSHARLTLVSAPEDPDRFDLTCVRDDRPQPLELNGSNALLFIHHSIRVVGDHCQTLAYSYRLQHSAARQDWVVRWEYLRQAPDPTYDYPLGHLHLKADLIDRAAAGLITKPASKLHIATGRLAFELVLWHLISEWGVAPLKLEWKTILRESIEGFEGRRTAS